MNKKNIIRPAKPRQFDFSIHTCMKNDCCCITDNKAMVFIGKKCEGHDEQEEMVICKRHARESIHIVDTKGN